MKYIIWFAIMLSIFLSIWLFEEYSKPTVYERQTETKEVKVEVDALTKKIEDAITASSTEIEARAKAAYENAKHQAEVEVKLEVTSAYRAELEKKEKELQEESISYWREIANVKQLIRDTFPDDLRMIEVARLESGFTHYLDESGQKVLKGHVTPADTGLMQVNCTTWCDDAKALGLNIWNIKDNVKMARYIYDTQGITAWVAYKKHMAVR